MTDKQLTLSDGRNLSYAEFGNEDGRPVLFFHGSPGSRYEAEVALHGAATLSDIDLEENVRLLALERPGYGLSDPKNDRTILDWTKDVQELLNSLDLFKVDVIGVSGGGPYAIACAAELGDRVGQVAVVCGIGPLDVPGLEGISDEEKLTVQAATHAPDKVAEEIADIHANPESMAGEATSALPDLDKSILSPDIIQRWLRSVKEATRQPEGMIGDFRLFGQSWGINFEKIQVPVHFWHGDQDATISLEHPHYLVEQIDGATLEVLEGAGHLGTGVIGTGRALAWFRD